MELTIPRVFLCGPSGGSLVHRHTAPTPVSVHDARDDSAHRPLVPYVPRFILVRTVSPSEFLRPHSRPEPFGAGPSARVSVPLRDITRTRPQSRKLPKPRFIPSSGSLNLPTVCSARELRGLFHPRAASRAPPVQGLLSPRSGPSLVEKAGPLAVGSPGARRPFSASAPDGPRLRGVVPREAAFRAVRNKPRPPAAPLFGLSLLQVPLRSP
jgi:hypothetical protein